MKTKMAEGSDCFSIGSIVSCETIFNQKYEGEVVAFDPPTKILILKCQASNGRANQHDVHLLNLNLVSDVNVKKEADKSPPSLQNLNLYKLSSRFNQQWEEKMRVISAMADGVSPEGQQLFLTITKTIKEVTWNGKNIMVMNQVIIQPPYGPDNCISKNKKDATQALTHVRKIIEKHIKDQQLGVADPNSLPASNSVSPQQPPQA